MWVLRTCSIEQLQIASRSSPEPTVRPTNRFFLGLLVGPLDSWLFNVKLTPNSHWCAQQLRDAFCNHEPPIFLLRDRDATFGEMFTETVTALGVDPLLTAYRSPVQNGSVERLIGSFRRECLDHVIVLNETHLRGIFQQNARYYNTQRTHLGRDKDAPAPRGVQVDGEIKKTPVVGGLHHYYFRRAVWQQVGCSSAGNWGGRGHLRPPKSAALLPTTDSTPRSTSQESSPPPYYLATDTGLRSGSTGG